jgi:hypothetical protein
MPSRFPQSAGSKGTKISTGKGGRATNGVTGPTGTRGRFPTSSATKATGGKRRSR